MGDHEKTILLVEDEALIAIDEGLELESRGYTVVYANSGDKAVDRIRADNGTIDLVLMDINLGRGIDGTEAARLILQEHDLPIVFLSSHTEPEIVEKIEKITSFGYVVKNTGITVLDASIRMAFRLHRAQQETESAVENLRREIDERKVSEEKFSKAFNACPEAMVIVSTETGKFIDVNAAFCSASGFSRNDTIGRVSTEIPLWPDIDEFRRYLETLRRDGSLRNFETRLRKKNGELRFFLVSSEIIHVSGRPCTLSFMLDITEKRKAEEALRESEERYRSLVETADVSILLTDLAGNHLFRNNAYYTNLGFEAGDPVEVDGFSRVHPDDVAAVRSAMEELFRMGTAECEYRVRHRDGHWTYRHNRGRIIPDADGRPGTILSVVTDVTARRQAEESLRQALGEKDVLMRELQHRVKNSLATAAGMISLEQAGISDERARAVLDGTKTRLQTMAVLYDRLNSTNRVDRIDMREYLQSIVDVCSHAYLPSGNTVELETRLASLELDPKRAVALGLIVNELLTNAFKYAFPRRSTGSILVELKNGDDHASLRVEDDGIGLAASSPCSEGSGSGLKLVEMLTDQLDGRLTVENDRGLRMLVTFPKQVLCLPPRSDTRLTHA